MKEHDHATGEARKTCKGLFFSVFSVSVWFNSGFQDEDLSERVDAFAARFGRLQDALSDKLLPARFALAGEPPRPAVEVLDRAERLGLIASTDAFLAVRKPHNRLVRAYVEDRDEPAVNPDAAHAFVPHLRSALQNLAQAIARLEKESAR